MADSTTDNFDWVTAQGGCTAEEMFKRLLDGARQDVDRRNASGFGRTDGWRFEVHSDDDDHFEVTRVAGSKSSAFVTFERVGPRINISGDGVDVELFATVSINPSGACRRMPSPMRGTAAKRSRSWLWWVSFWTSISINVQTPLEPGKAP